MRNRIYPLGLRPQMAIPSLIEVQSDSYQWFLDEGIKELLAEISPIKDFTEKKLSLEFGDYFFVQPKFDEKIAKQKNLTYKASLKCKTTLTNIAAKRSKTSEVFLGDFPLMTDRGTFIINGIERAVVTQIVRSYGVLFVKNIVTGRKLFGAKLIPSRGCWLELETSLKDVISVKIDRKRKLPITTFLKVIGLANDKQILSAFADVDTDPDHQYIKSTLAKDQAKNYNEALIEVYKHIRPGDLVTAESAQSFIEAMLFNPKRYDLGKVGRYKINQRLGLKFSEDITNRILKLDDVIATVKEIIRLNNDINAEEDDVDHLKCRRLRAVGELVQGRLRVGLLRMERIIKDRMSVVDPDTAVPSQLLNNRPIQAVLQEFFASSQLSQFMDQTNPISELEHKRRLAATGPGGLSRERAGFEVRDVHPSHYGRLCPIATPEGPNVGLVTQLATYAKVNKYGFIETPYYLVKKAKGQKPQITKDIKYISAAEEDRYTITAASIKTDKNGYILDQKVIARKKGEPIVVDISEIDMVDVAPSQILSISAALIPYIEHDEAVRSMMGANMQRQAVPLIRSEAPFVGTGIEKSVAENSGSMVMAKNAGIVQYVSADEIIIGSDKGTDVYKLEKFIRSNQATNINQKPIVNSGDKVKAGDVLADGPSTDQGEAALGKNVLAAFVSFLGSNYEDAIVISERLVNEDIFSSIHIEKYSIEVRETKLGAEVITRDIPNVGEETLSNLDGSGIVRIGAEVKSNDILVGKITPKGETELSAEEKLLRAIFGEKAKDVKDTSLRLPHGQRGKVVDIKIFSKEAGDELSTGVYQMVEVSVAQFRKVQIGDKLAGRHGNKGVIAKILPQEEMPYLPDGTPVDIILNPLGVVSRMNLGQILETHLGWAAEKLGKYYATPVFNGINYENIQKELKEANLPIDGKIQLYDGRTGEPFDQKTTVGQIYMLKLIHMVDDKVHARSIGPYSMVTQQPLGGKAQFGGQRFGEMEVWALEAYGAAHTLQEMLTIKSDDVIGRSKAYEAIIKGEPIQKPQIPASFFVLVRELQSIGLDVEMVYKNQSDFKKAELQELKNK